MPYLENICVYTQCHKTQFQIITTKKLIKLQKFSEVHIVYHVSLHLCENLQEIKVMAPALHSWDANATTKFL